MKLSNSFAPLLDLTWAKHFKRPLFYNVAYECEGWVLYIDIDSQNEVIKELSYQGPVENSAWGAFFELLASQYTGRKIVDVRLSSWESQLLYLSELAASDDLELAEYWDDFLIEFEESIPWKLPFLNIPIYMLNEAKKDYLGRISSRGKSLGYDASTLICRCFGVYRGDIEELLKTNQGELTLLDLTAKTRAGAGCATCIEDLENAIDDARDTLGLAPMSLNPNDDFRIKGLTQAALILEIDKRLKESGQIKLAQVEIESLSAYKLAIHSPDNSKEFLQEISEYLFSQLKIRFHLSIDH